MNTRGIVAGEPQAEAVIDTIVAAAQRILGVSLVGVILHGSLTSGDYRPGVSDIDLLAIVGRELTDLEQTEISQAALGTVIAADLLLDLRLVTTVAALDPQPVPTMELLVGRHLPEWGDGEVILGPVGEPDLLFEFAISATSPSTPLRVAWQGSAIRHVRCGLGRYQLGGR
jgi:predicted nucleotidyltransferase